MNEKTPTCYTYQVEGLSTIGTLADYAKAYERWHYSCIHLSPTVLDWKGTHHVVKIVERIKDEDDCIRYTLCANGETAFAHVDRWA